MTSTSQVHSLEELQNLAKPALADVRLVDLARDGKVPIDRIVSIAEGLGGVSRRQTRATRWLAIIRRDHGTKALNSYVSSMARARADSTATEHAHPEKKIMSNDRFLKSLELIKDPHRKLELMLNKGMNVTALAYLKELIETKTAFFWLNDGGGLGRLLLPPDEASLKDRINKVVLICHDDREFSINHSSGIVVSLTGLRSLFGEAANPLIAEVLKRTVAIDPRRCGGVASYWNVRGTTEVARKYLKPEDGLYKEVEIWQTRYHFDDGRLPDLYRCVIPMDKQDGKFQSPPRKEQLNWLVDWFYSLGWALHQVQCEFAEWLENRAQQGLPADYLIAVAAAKCFQSYPRLPRLVAALQKCLSKCWQQLIEECTSRMTMADFAELGKLGMFSRDHDSFFKVALTRLLSEGKAAKVTRLLVGLGRNLGLCDWDNVFPSAKTIEQSVKAALDSMSVSAFDQAVEAGQFGIAAAIGQHFSCVDETALHLKANRALRAKLGAVIDWEKVYDRPNNPEEFWDQVLEGEVSDALENDPPYAWYISGRDAPDWMISPLTEEQKTVLPQLKAERDELLKELIRLRNVQISEAVETAIVLEQPIAFDLITVL